MQNFRSIKDRKYADGFIYYCMKQYCLDSGIKLQPLICRLWLVGMMEDKEFSKKLEAYRKTYFGVEREGNLSEETFLNQIIEQQKNI